jgi:predicted nucleic acid-binding protein
LNGVEFIVDTNILIAFDLGIPNLEHYTNYNLGISCITEIELLGYSKNTEKDIADYTALIKEFEMFELTTSIKAEAIYLKRKYNIKTPDAIIAATAIHAKVPLISNDKGFNKIKELVVLTY